jgi:Spy/CpxP family protein refolding chaperone
MKLKLISLSAIGAFALGSSAFAQTPQPAGQPEQGQRGRHGGDRHSSLERTMDELNLTPEQKAKVQPIVDQATPQIESIRRDAMQKIKAITDNAMAQIRPMLTPDQQKTLDEAQNDRRGGRGGHHGRRGQGGQGDQDDG